MCDNLPNVNISKCVTMEEVCDGEMGCPGGDDETLCGKCCKTTIYIIVKTEEISPTLNALNIFLMMGYKMPNYAK